MSDRQKNSTPGNTRPDQPGDHLFKLKVKERSQRMLRAIAARPQPEGFRRYIDPALHRLDPVNEVQRCIGLFREFLVDVEVLGYEELKPKGKIDTAEFFRDVLRPAFFAVISNYRETLWRAITDVPPEQVRVLYWNPAKEIFEKELRILDEKWAVHFDIKIVQLEKQESQPRPSEGQVPKAPTIETQEAPDPLGTEANAEARENEVSPERSATQQIVDLTTKETAPKGFDGLEQKQMDLSHYFDDADLTERQREYASMKYEYGLRVIEIARRTGTHHSTVQEALTAITRRLERDDGFQRKLKRRAAHRGSHDEG